jgi:hypothetical protein
MLQALLNYFLTLTEINHFSKEPSKSTNLTHLLSTPSVSWKAHLGNKKGAGEMGKEHKRSQLKGQRKKMLAWEPLQLIKSTNCADIISTIRPAK